MSGTDDNPRRDRVLKLAFQNRALLEAYAYGLLGNHATAEDLVQETFLVVLSKYESFEEGTSILAWTRAILRHKVLQLLEKKKRRAGLRDRMLMDAVDAAFERFHDEDRTALLKEQRKKLRACMAKLGDRARDLIHSVYTEERSYAEAGHVLGMSIEAVRKMLYRSKQQLRTCVQADEATT